MVLKLNKIIFCVGAGFCIGLLFLFPLSSQAATLTIKNILSEINYQRQIRELRPLQINQTLTNVADIRAHDMVINDYFAHQSPNGLWPWDIAVQENYNYKILGENLALDYMDTKNLINDWMNSVQHRNNILNPQYLETGLAVTNKNDGLLIVQIFAQPKISNYMANADFEDKNEQSVVSIIPNNQPTENEAVLGTFNVKKQTIRQIHYLNLYNLWILLLASGFFTTSMSLLLLPEKNN